MAEGKVPTVTEADVESQVAALKSVAAKSTDPCLTAKYIALADERVRSLLLKKVQEGYVFKRIECLEVISVPENKYVLFDFDCKPGTFCLIKPAFLVVVNMIGAYVTAIVDPYVPTAFGLLGSDATSARGGCDNCRNFFPKYGDLKDWLRKARDAGQFNSEDGCKQFVNDTTTAAGIIAQLLGGGVAAAVIEEALRQCGKCACKDIY
ncbi:MAG TPA: hypothetical protein VHR66_05240 [Gemmataceae bacterium]|jgi:hypothetical protein|nr:hypothetical protein [Gemmataceae bacterium]